MTTIISRLYRSADTAHAAEAALRAAGHDAATIRIVPAEGDDPAARLAAAGVGATSAAAYGRAMAAGQAVLVVRAPFTPFGRARSAMQVADGFGPLEVAGVNANQHVPDQPDPRIFHPAITRHAHVMTTDMPPFIARRRGTVSSAFGLPLLMAGRRARALPRGPFLSRLLGLPMLSRRRPRGGLLPAGSFLSRLFWPLPLLAGQSR